MGKIAIFAPFSAGDMTISTCILRYKNILWPKSEIVWFSSTSNYDILKFTPEVSEIRVHCTHHYGPDVRKADRSGELSPNRNKFDDTSDLDLGYYTTPWGNPNLLRDRFDIPYAFFPRVVIGGKMPEWKPCVFFSKEEDDKAKNLIGSLPYKKTVMLETKSKSGQSLWDDSCTSKTLEILRSTVGNCNFVFASPGSHIGFESNGVVDCSEFTARQCIPIYNRCQLFIGVSSGVGCLTTSWSAVESVPRIEFCHNSRMSTCHLVKGQNVLCTTREHLFNSVADFAKQIA
jgi:hypothetical protein